jgi:3-phenylpropionate/trans-cinnamate dioxygenase ferredoxin subunit
MAGFVTVGKSDEVTEGEAAGFDAGGVPVAVARLGGELLAFSDICTHRQCNLASGGEIEGTTIECECHGSTFDMRTGEVVLGPATDPIATYAVEEADGEIRVKVE